MFCSKSAPLCRDLSMSLLQAHLPKHPKTIPAHWVTGFCQLFLPFQSLISIFVHEQMLASTCTVHLDTAPAIYILATETIFQSLVDHVLNWKVLTNRRQKLRKRWGTGERKDCRLCVASGIGKEGCSRVLPWASRAPARSTHGRLFLLLHNFIGQN